MSYEIELTMLARWAGVEVPTDADYDLYCLPNPRNIQFLRVTWTAGTESGRFFIAKERLIEQMELNDEQMWAANNYIT